ncbi:MAG: type II secretion system protein N [Gammaproteobacteria bacterium]|nr:type II secretion system protein N [Gammaproteobacteria bacterium]
MPRSRVIIVAAVAAFLLTLVGTLPAAVVLPWVAPAGFRPLGIGGTVWRGTLTGAEIGPARLGMTSWELNPAALLVGRLQATVATRLGDGVANGSVAIGLGGELRCQGCRYEGPVASLRQFVPALPALDARLDLDLAQLALRDRWPSRAVGTASLTGVPLGVPGMAVTAATPRATLGFSVDADPVGDDGVIAVAVQDKDGPVELQARLTVTPPGSFELAGRARARPDAPAAVAGALSALGRPAPDGTVEIGFAGTF